MCDSVPPKVYEILKNAVEGDIENYEITIHDANKKGEGFLGEIVFVTLEDKHSDQVLKLVVKQAFTNQAVRDQIPIHDIFENEIYFYTKVWTRLNQFQNRIPSEYQFQKMPRCIASISEDHAERLVLENLKFHGYEVHNKKIPLSKEHYELIMKEYGKFHALSFAYKALYPKDYANLTDGLKNIYSDLSSTEGFQDGIKMSTKISLDSLQEGVDGAVIQKYKEVVENGVQMFQDSLDCQTKYTVITHGDCWSNNMMFKYNEEKKLTDVRFIDFQLSKEGSPCCDLSYCIYSGAPKEVLQDFDYYLQVYHDSLSATLKAFGCDSETLYPLKELKNDWKRYCKLGLIMGLMIWKIKFTYEGKIRDISDSIANREEAKQAYLTGYDKEAYQDITRTVILHLYEKNFL